MSNISPELEAARAFALTYYRNNSHVTGIDIGIEDRDGSPVKGSLAVRLLVKEKLDRDDVPKDQLFEEVMAKAGHEVKTDVIEASAKSAPERLDAETNDRKPNLEQLQRCNPIQPGISVSHALQGAGTFGLVVQDEKTGNPGILGCTHVLAPGSAKKGDPVHQPGLVDGGDSRFDDVAYIERWILDEDGDACFAVLNKKRMLELAQFGGQATITSVATEGVVEMGMKLEKVGRGSGWTKAEVDGIGYYRPDLIHTSPVWIKGFRLVPVGGNGNGNGHSANGKGGGGEISLPGDSGAIWYRKRGAGAEGVGLHIDGEKPGERDEYAIACHLGRVTKRLGLSLPGVMPEQSARILFGSRRGSKVTLRTLPPELSAWAREHQAKLHELCCYLEHPPVPGPVVRSTARGKKRAGSRAS